MDLSLFTGEKQCLILMSMDISVKHKNHDDDITYDPGHPVGTNSKNGYGGCFMKDKVRDRLASMSLPYNNKNRVPVDRNKLGPMVNGYITCALWSTPDDSFFGDGSMLDENYHTKFTISEPTLLQMIRDCVGFYWRNRMSLEALYESGFYDESDAGHDFWLSRNGHGAGFFDRGRDDVWDELQASAMGWGTFDLWVNDDNEVAADFTQNL